jgi:hypothetical protein
LVSLKKTIEKKHFICCIRFEYYLPYWSFFRSSINFTLCNMNWRLVAIIGCLLIGLYFGTGGITKMENYNLIKTTLEQTDTSKVSYKGVTFQNKGALIRTLEEEQMDSIYPWINELPSYVSYIITACAFGMLGALIHLFIQIAFNKKTLEELPVYSLPILGLLTGLVVLGVSLVFPTLLFNTEKDIKPSGLMFLSLFSGIFIDKVYDKLTDILTNKKEN